MLLHLHLKILKNHIFIHFFIQVLDASWYMPDEQRNPIQEYQVFIVLVFENTIFFLRIFIPIIQINIAIWYHHDILLIPFLLEFDLSSDLFPWINPTPTGCSHSWCPFLRCRWNSRPNYECEIASLISIFEYTPIQNVHMLAHSNVHMLAHSNIHMHICFFL